MKISVIMPAYNAEQYIGEAIDSILCQSFRDFELIILNDSSKDGTEGVILSYDDPRIVYVKNEENLGVARTLNRGLALAKGQYIARMDADDISLPERFQKQAQYLDSHPDCVVCGSSVEKFGAAKGVCAFPETDEKIRTAMLLSNPVAHPSVMLRAQILRQHGLVYEEAFEKVEDYRLWIRLADKGGFYNFQTPLLRYRIHPQQVCVTASAVQHEARLRLARERLRLPEELLEPVVSAFDGTLAEKTEYRKFLQAAQALAAAGEAPDPNHLKLMLKSQIIGTALEKSWPIPGKCMGLVGVKAFVYVNFKYIRGKR